ncbi:bacteriocin fulvocin C-related protein [Streptomyces anulatus]|uniref:bacteriocin fulvocin C-related protein n=1 Tax=Streptomyces anulatus TaxID=1892 RepID=UPI0033D4B6A8
MAEWILAFDSACRYCADVVERVRTVSTGKLTVAPLSDARVRGMRHHALGEQPPWAPTLLSVDATGVRAWTGTALSARLALVLGPLDSVRTLRALNDAEILRLPSRRKLLKAFPGLALGTFVLSGGLTAPAARADAPPHEGRAARWVRDNAGRLPTSYGELITHPMGYRRAIFAAVPPSVRVTFWQEHFEDFRSKRAPLTPAQAAVIDTATRLTHELRTEARDEPARQALRAAALEAFGASETRALLATLGPPDTEHPTGHPTERSAVELANCDSSCATGSFNCDGSLSCWAAPWHCNRTSSGCGWMWIEPCSGTCR